MSRRTYTDEQEEGLVADYQAGLGTKALIAKYGGTKTTVLRCVKRHGVQTKPGGRRHMIFTADQVAEMAERWATGESQASIGRSFGCSQPVVSCVLIRAGVRAPGDRKTARGSRHGSWKGGVNRTDQGYLQEKVDQDDPMFCMVNRMGYVPQHRLVMARSLGRPLSPDETVHHINGARDDNRIENLQMRQGRHGKGVVTVCLDCGSHNVATTALETEQ